MGDHRGQTGDGGRRAERDSEPASPARLVLSFTQHHPQRDNLRGPRDPLPAASEGEAVAHRPPASIRLAKPQSANLFGGRAARPVAGSGCSSSSSFSCDRALSSVANQEARIGLPSSFALMMLSTWSAYEESARSSPKWINQHEKAFGREGRTRAPPRR